MRFRTTAVLLIVFLALAGYVVVVEMNKKPPEPPADKSTWVLTLGRDDVQQLQVSDQGASVVLVRADPYWHVGAIGGPEADATRVESIVASLVDLRSTRVLTQTAEGPAAFGLDKPAITVTIVVSENQQEVLYIGDKNPQGSAYYVQRKGQTPIHLIYAWLVEDLKRLVSDPPYKPTPTPTVEPPPSPGAVEPVATPTP